MSVATATALTIAGIGATAGTSLYGAHKVSSSANKAAKLTTDSANHAADLEAASAREALDFTKQEAQQKAERDEADRRANYDQWAAQMNAHNAARARYGYATSTIPGYVAGKVPSYTNSPGAALMGQAPINPVQNTRGWLDDGSGVTTPRSVGSMLIQPTGPKYFDPPIGGTPYELARDPRVLADPGRGLPTRPAPRSIGASLYGGR